MNPASEPLTQEVLAGLVERVTFHNAENGFCVLKTKARGHRDLVTGGRISRGGFSIERSREAGEASTYCIASTPASNRA